MKNFTTIVAVISALILAGTLQAQTLQRLQTTNPEQSNVSRKISADDFQELQAQGTDIENDNIGKAGIFADPNMQRTMACATAFIMNTPYNSNNGQRGCMFDVLAANTITISCFESNLYAGTTGNYEIHYRPSTHVGFENNSAGWTLLGSATGVTSAGNNLPTALPIPVGVTIPAGQTYSFYITNDFGAGTSYTDGTAVGNFLASDANLTVFEGVGKSYPFGLTFNVRNFNGHIFYDLGSVFDANEATISAEKFENQIKLAWEVPATEKFQKVELEYASNAGRFEVIQALDQNKESGQLQVVPEGKENWYRLRLTSLNGEQNYSNIAKVTVETDSPFKLLGIAPNPSQGDVILHFEHHAKNPVTIHLTDAQGKIVFESTRKAGDHQLNLPLAELNAGIYLLSLSCEGQRETRRLVHQ